MKRSRKPLIMGNWKMHPKTGKLATRLFTDIKKQTARVQGPEVVIAPAFVHLSMLRDVQRGKQPLLGAQDCYHEPIGAFTGEVSVPMLKDAGVSYVILGHSERRARGERDEDVQKKLAAVLKASLKPVLCVGEAKRDSHGEYFTFVEKQIRTACSGIAKTKLKDLIVAYEPIWAIGTGRNATPGDAHEMKLFIQKVLTDIFGRNDAMKVRVLYGGSVNAKNAEELLVEGTVDGFLIGGASLKADEFASIVKTAANVR